MALESVMKVIRRPARHEIPEKLHAAKRHAVERMLAPHPAPRRRIAGPVKTHPHHNVVGVGIGRKIVGGRPQERPCVRLYVAHKLDRNLVPPEHVLPKKIEGVETDVIEIGHLHAQAAGAARKRRRPVQPGCSVGFQLPPPHDDLLMAGTLGAVVARGASQFILSNNHILANENALPIGTEILQPGPLDHGVGADVIARLTQFVPLTADAPNHLDCAIAQVIGADGARGRALAKVGKLESDQPIDAVEGMRVEKVGRGSGYTVGEVFDVAATIQLQYELGLLTFADQILIRTKPGHFSEYGDSGALVVDIASGRATGLLIGGDGNFSIANHFSDVLNALGVTLVV